MQQAIERLRKTIKGYASGDLSRSLATIELVSSFKVALKETDAAASERGDLISNYIEALLGRIDANQLSAEHAIEELGRTYKATHSKDPTILNHMAEYQGGSTDA